MLETIVGTLDISNSFAKWAEKFDNAEAAAREAKGIKVLSATLLSKRPKKVRDRS